MRVRSRTHPGIIKNDSPADFAKIQNGDYDRDLKINDGRGHEPLTLENEGQI